MERDAHRRGIIPAYAGNTMLTRPGHTQLGDHPRVCGEHRLAGLVGHVPGGSSPRMRGTHAARRMPRHRPGIIPAYAGNTPMSWSMSSPCRDHPRVCGEHLFCSGCVLLFDRAPGCGGHEVSAAPPSISTGSSPRMRGTQTIEPVHERVRGIIPAYAGNTPVRVAVQQ